MSILMPDEGIRQLLTELGLSGKNVTSLKFDFTVGEVATMTVERMLNKEDVVKLRKMLDRYILVRVDKSGRMTEGGKAGLELCGRKDG